MRQRLNERGQEMAELGIVIVLLILFVGGIMQFGHAFMVANMITHGARDGARLAASWTSRGLCGGLTSTGGITTAVTNTIATVTAETFTVTVSQKPPIPAGPPCCAPGVEPTVTVNVNGCVPYVFNILGLGSTGCSGGFKVDRNVTFTDELRCTFGS